MKIDKKKYNKKKGISIMSIRIETDNEFPKYEIRLNNYEKEAPLLFIVRITRWIIDKLLSLFYQLSPNRSLYRWSKDIQNPRIGC